MDLVARFDRGPLEEVRASLVNRNGQTCLDLRVWGKTAAGEQEPMAASEGIIVPLALLASLAGAIRAVGVALRRRNLLPREAPEAARMAGGAPSAAATPAPAGPPAAGVGARPLGRADLRLRLDCPVEYSLRHRLRPEQPATPRRGRTKDISRTGMQVMLPERIPVPTALRVTLHLPVGVITLPCEVVWAQHLDAADVAREGCRRGLRFTQVGSAEYTLLDRLVGEAARQPSAPPT